MCKMRTVEWDDHKNQVRMIDQRLLPGELAYIWLADHHQVANAITDMAVRGAPAIGATAAFGLALAAQISSQTDKSMLLDEIQTAAEVLRAARPTAVNLGWALDRMLHTASQIEGDDDDLRSGLLDEAQIIANEDIEINKRMADYGASLIKPGDKIIHHCNTGSLATVEWGTALGVIRTAHNQNKAIHVFLDETRPRLQGARLSAWELEQYGVPYDIISDNAAGYLLSSGEVDKVFVGADRVAGNGDVANKIGTYMLALAAKDNDIPFYAVVPTSTIDLSISSGAQIPIEERDPEEVLNIQREGHSLSPEGATARNPAFDVTPHRLITAIVTENGIVEPPYDINLPKAVHGDS